MYRIIDLPQDTNEWLQWRKSVIGASEIAAILGVSPWATPRELYRQKKGLVENPFNSGMARGKKMEAEAIECLSKTVCLNFEKHTLQSEQYPWLGASLDGWSKDRKSIAEVKCPNKEVVKMAQEGTLPDYYFWQCQQQLLVSGAQVNYYFAYAGKNVGHVVEVYPDQDAFNTIIRESQEWWGLYITDEEPAPSHKDYVAIESPEALDAAEQWAQANRNLKAAKELEEAKRKILLDLSDDGNFEVSLANGAKVKGSRVNSTGSVQWKKVWEEVENHFPDVGQKIDPEAFRKEQAGYWRLTESCST